MDMFGKKKITELERDIFSKDLHISRLENDLTVLTAKLSEIQKYANSTPPDCVRGRWCEACEFAKSYRVTTYPGNWIETIYICGKGESCKNFVQKEKD